MSLLHSIEIRLETGITIKQVEVISLTGNKCDMEFFEAKVFKDDNDW